MKILKRIVTILAVCVITGCAHPLVITPEIENVKLSAADQPIKKNVAYYIADDLINQQVVTPGGGGDKVAYKPYRDIEVGFFKMLSNSFANVTKLKTENDKAALEQHKVDYIVMPKIVTDSSSTGVFTWMPTDFSLQLSSDITDVDGNVLFSKTVTGTGHAEYNEFFEMGFSIAGKRASEDALLKMQKTLLDMQELR